jgi:hypothetical protein
MRRVNAYDRDIGIRVITNQVGLLTATIGEGHYELGSAMHDVAISQNKTVRRKDKS